MVEATKKCQLNRKSKPFPLIGLIRSNTSNKKDLGSGVTSPTILNSIRRCNDPYMPHIQQYSHSSTSLPAKHHHSQHPAHRNINSSTPHLVTQPRRKPVTPLPESPQHIHHHHYYFNSSADGYDTVYTTTTANATNKQHFYTLNSQSTSSSQLPPLSPPPLSPTNQSFATNARPSWRDMARSPTYQPASSISSSDIDDDDDEPIGLLLSSKPYSLLSETSEDGDDELVPIAHLSNSNTYCLSAAEKYKAKVRARLQMTDNSDVTF